MNAAYQLHQFEDTGYGLEIRYVQPEAGQRIRLARLGLHRRYLPRIVAGVVAGTVHRHHGLRHHVTPIRTLGFTTRARVHARPYLGSLVPEWKATGSKHPGEQNGEPSRTGTTGRTDRGTPVVCVHHGPRARRPLPLRTTYGINSGARYSPTIAATLRPLPTVPDQSTKSDKFVSILSDLVPDSRKYRRSGMGRTLINNWEK